MNDNIEEHKIPEWDNVKLCRCVAEWLGDVQRSRTSFDTSAMIVLSDEASEETIAVPDYCNSAKHAWRLLERMPQMVVQMGDGSTFSGAWLELERDPKRALAEAAATLAVRGREPKEPAQ